MAISARSTVVRGGLVTVAVLGVLFAVGSRGSAGSRGPEPALTSTWGIVGHRIVGSLAERLLTGPTLARVDELLDGASLGLVASWADGVKQTRNQGPDHYLNVPRTARSVDMTRDAADGRNVVDAIRRYAAVLADESLPKLERSEALRYLVHYVGDVHQPLHVSFADDRGGNDVEVECFGTARSLHAAWDSGLITRRGSDWREIEADLAGRLTPARVAALSAQTDPVEWANESLAITRDVYVELPEFDGQLLEDYYARNIHRVEERLIAAGVRLAALLEPVLARSAADATSPPLAAAPPQPPTIFFGNLHSHTSYSDGSGTPEQAYRHARDVAGLDFLAITEHNHARAEWGAGDRRDGLLIGLDPTLYVGPAAQALIPAALRLSEDGEFIALYGQEFSTISAGNHLNVFEIGEVIDVPNGEFDDLVVWLGARPDSQGQPAILQFNHPWSSSSPAAKEYGIDDFANQDSWVEEMDERVQLIEVINGPAMTTVPGQQPAHVREKDYLDYLNRGFHLAPTANQDNHYFTWGSSTAARTGVVTNELTRSALLDALRNRHVYASEDANLEISAWIDDHLCGDILLDLPNVGAELDVHFWIHDRDEPERTYVIDVLSDTAIGGEPAEVVESYSWEGNALAPFPLEGLSFAQEGQYFLFRVTQVSEHGDSDRAWTAPIWMGGPAGQPELDVRIISLLANPAGDERLGEALTLRNFGTTSIVLDDWLVRDLAGKVWVLSGTLAADEERLILRAGQAMAMNNGGDTIELITADGEVVQSVTYESTTEGETLVVTNALDG